MNRRAFSQLLAGILGAVGIASILPKAARAQASTRWIVLIQFDGKVWKGFGVIKGAERETHAQGWVAKDPENRRYDIVDELT